MSLFKIESVTPVVMLGAPFGDGLFIRASNVEEAKRFLASLGIKAEVVGYRDNPPVDSTVLDAAA